ncbi:uncharacterized protein [Hoplias malabaricus]|uniref:uncharacterized protein n=1 Tax=Hoplias malabaricus TaxID=27720 RepID=UPI0034635DA7
MSPVSSTPKYTTGSTLLSSYRLYDPCNPSLGYISRGHPQPSRYSPSTSRYITPGSCLARISLSLPQESDRGRAISLVETRNTHRSESSSRMQVTGQAAGVNWPRGHLASQAGFSATSPLSRWHRSVSQSDLAQELATLDLCEHKEFDRGAYITRENAGIARTVCSGPFYWNSEGHGGSRAYLESLGARREYTLEGTLVLHSSGY